MKKSIKNFDFSTFSFYGNSLIEASAGTGKTHTIVMLYLYLLLGIHSAHYVQELTIEKILVVTFTKKAVEELRERIRNSIFEFRIVCIEGHSKNLFFLEILERINDLNLAYRRLSEAEQKIDKIQIFTIHSFCQHILNIYPIELNSIFQYSILKDENTLLQKACNDFWRRYFYSLPIEIAYIIEEYWKDPRKLLLEISPYLYNQTINVQPVLTGDIITQHEYIINYINYVKKIWNQEQDKLLTFCNNFSFNRHIYNNKNITNWLKNINVWAQEQVTKTYKIPKELKYFRYSVMIVDFDIQNLKTSLYSLFKSIEILFGKIKLLKQLILNIAICKVREISKNIKDSFSEISFHDLICLLDHALHCPIVGKKLAQSIREDYPIAIIDEFQDTDFQQYRIFRTLYSFSCSKYGLLLIGDPKQAIYSFRGADIFSYLLARENIDVYYTLNVNWRSSKGMVNAVNTLFQFSTLYPFIFKNIPFSPVKSAKNNEQLSLIIKNKLSPSLCLYLPDSDKLSLHEYQKIIANKCARTIYNLLYGSNLNYVWLQNAIHKRKLKASDIVILVRNHDEGFLISSILEKFNIKTSYLSNQRNIFKTDESIDLLLILEAVLTPENDNSLRCALITSIIGYNAQDIDQINQNEQFWKKEFDEFTYYFFFWGKYGVQAMIQEILFRRSIAKNFLLTSTGEQCLINILHLGEILQKKSLELNSKHLLIRWLNTQINLCNICSEDQVLRSRSNCQFVKIITIHKSKGLEFPLVFLPFVFFPYKNKYPLFHNRTDYQLYLDLNNLSKYSDLSEEERLSEDLRILYVAITRAIYYCFVGIGAISLKKNSKKNISDLHRTALGYLIQSGIPGNLSFLKKCLKKLTEHANGDIVCNFFSENDIEISGLCTNNEIINSNVYPKSLFAKEWTVSVNCFNKITSYTELYRLNKLNSSSKSKLNYQEIVNQQINKNNKVENNNILFTPHTFPRGNISGDFLHYIFQKWNFKEKIDSEWLIRQLNKKSIDLVWLPVLQSWLMGVASTPLDNKNLMLSNLSSFNYCTELQFYLSVNNLVSAKEFDNICKRYDPISRLSSTLQFSNILGMIHGFIDLVFFWKGKYYLLDYKSNWLGDTYNSYFMFNMKNAMILHQYALQYQIYTLALHRFLRCKLKHYDYNRDFGGVYYLFLRGIDIMYPGCGIYFCRPDQLLIHELDKLLSFSHSTVSQVIFILYITYM